VSITPLIIAQTSNAESLVVTLHDTYLNKSTSPNMTLDVDIPAFSIVKCSGWAVALNAEVGLCWWGELKNI